MPQEALSATTHCSGFALIGDAYVTIDLSLGVKNPFFRFLFGNASKAMSMPVATWSGKLHLNHVPEQVKLD